jgi:hypothetical protein
MAGASSDQKLAAIMTPAAKSQHGIQKGARHFPAANTIAAPNAVMNQVKSPARPACRTGCQEAKVFMAVEYIASAPHTKQRESF